MKKICTTIVAIMIIFSLLECATIMHGTTQKIGIGSNPSGASVSINGASVGQTPLFYDLKRKDNYIVKIELSGYLLYETTITRKVSGWVWGNILFGGLIGLAVDAITGGLYNLTPEQLQAELRKGEIDIECKDNCIYILTVLESNPNWVKIGSLQKR